MTNSQKRKILLLTLAALNILIEKLKMATKGPCVYHYTISYHSPGSDIVSLHLWYGFYSPFCHNVINKAKSKTALAFKRVYINIRSYVVDSENSVQMFFSNRQNNNFHSVCKKPSQ